MFAWSWLHSASALSVSALGSLNALIPLLQLSVLSHSRSSFPWGEPLAPHSSLWLEVWCGATKQTSLRLLEEIQHFCSLETNCQKSSLQMTSGGPPGKRAAGSHHRNWCRGQYLVSRLQIWARLVQALLNKRHLIQT